MATCFGFPFTERGLWKFEGPTVTGLSAFHQCCSSAQSRLKVVPEEVIISCDYQNHHHKCCWARTFLDAHLGEAKNSGCGVSRRLIKQICEATWNTIREVKKKPLRRRRITFEKCLPPVIRCNADGTNVYTLTGTFSIHIENISTTEDALRFVPDFLVVHPSEACMPYMWYDTDQLYSKCKIDDGTKPNLSQLLLCQGVHSTGNGCIATYTPFSWIICVNEYAQNFVVRNGSKWTSRKRRRHEEGFDVVPSEIDLEILVDGISLPYNDTHLINYLMALYDYRPSITKERRFGDHDQKLSVGYREGAINRKVQRIMEYLHDQVQCGCSTSAHENVRLRPIIQPLGVLKSSKSILVEKCENSNNNQLVAIFPNSFSFPFRLFSVENNGQAIANFPPTSTLKDVLDNL